MTGLPGGWVALPIRDVTLPITKIDPVDAGRQFLRYIDIGSVDGVRHTLTDVQEISALDAPSRARQVVQSGDTVFSTVRPYLEKIAYVTEELDGEFASTGFAVLRPGPRLLPRYLYYFSVSRIMLDQVLPLQKGVSYPAVLDSEVRAAVIPIPELDEQRRIVEVLEDHLSRLDAADASLIAATHRRALLAKASSAALVEKAESDDRVPQVALTEVARIGSGATPKRGVAKYWDNGTIPWITSGDLSQGLISAASQFVTETALNETALRLWPAGTLLVAMYGEGKTRGTVGELGVDATTNQACAAISLLDPSPSARGWLRLLLESRYDALRRQSSGGVQPNLTLGYFKSLVVPWPSPTLALSLASAHRGNVESIQRLERNVSDTMKRSARLRRSLLAAAFTGRLTRGASDVERIEELAEVGG